MRSVESSSQFSNAIRLAGCVVMGSKKRASNNGLPKNYDPWNPSYMEQAPSDEPLGTEARARFSAPVRITIVSYRSRLADADGVSAKAAIDGLVHAGIIEDDGPRFVKEVRYRQVKVKNKSEEKVELIIEKATKEQLENE